MNSVFVPDLLSFTTLSRNISKLTTQADTTRNEAVTGRYQDITKHLNGDVGSAHLVRKAVDDVIFYQQSLSLAEGRAQATQTILAEVGRDGNRISSQTLAALGQGNETAISIAATDARTAIFGVFSALNNSFGGRALFSGDATDRAPLASPEQLIADVEALIAGAVDFADAEAQLDFYFDDPAGGFNTSIYQGGANGAPKVELSPGVRINASAKADEPSIKDIIRGLASMAVAGSASFADVDSLIEASANRTIGAGSALTDLRARIGVSEARIGASMVRYESEEAILTGLFNDKTARDPYEAATELQLLETQIEASYLLTARLARLTIADYL